VIFNKWVLGESDGDTKEGGTIGLGVSSKEREGMGVIRRDPVVRQKIKWVFCCIFLEK